MKITRRNQNQDKSESLAVRDPMFSELLNIDRLDRLFDDSFFKPFKWLSQHDQFGGMTRLYPRVDISEEKDMLKIRAEVPGMDSNKINIEVTEDSIALSGKLERHEEEEKENFYRIERGYGEFSREFMLPSKIDTSSIDATSKNGVITIKVKKLPSEQKKKIQIRSES